MGGIKSRVKGFNAEFAQQGVLLNWAVTLWVPQHRTEAARVVQAQRGVFELPLNVIVFAQ